MVAQWLRICLPMQRIRVWSMAQEDPTCHGATNPVHHNYWACAPRARASQQEKPPQWEARASQRRPNTAKKNLKKKTNSKGFYYFLDLVRICWCVSGSGPQHFWHQGPVLWQTIFPHMGERGWFRWWGAEEALLTRLPLTSCCAARFLTGGRPLQVHAPGVGDPWSKVDKIESRCGSKFSAQMIPPVGLCLFLSSRTTREARDLVQDSPSNHCCSCHQFLFTLVHLHFYF